jgi:hypothetical protein
MLWTVLPLMVLFLAQASVMFSAFAALMLITPTLGSRRFPLLWMARIRVYLTCVRRLLGLPVISAPAPCPLCKQTMDVYGDHALCCKKSSDTITRHNRVRNLIFQFADMGLLSPELEKLGILGVTDRSRRRPGDVSFKSWAPHRGLAIDVAVICPLAASHLNQEEPCEDYAVLLHKHARYDESFKGSDYDFAAMVFETSGAVNSSSQADFSLCFQEVWDGSCFLLFEPGLVWLLAFRFLLRRWF